jgi:hypothetical protein
MSILDPIWLLTKEEEKIEIPDDLKVPPVEKEKTDDEEEEDKPKDAEEDEEVTVEDEKEEVTEKQTVTILNDKWVQLNAQAPIWMRYVNNNVLK